MPSLSMPLFISVEDVVLRGQLNTEIAGTTDIVTSGIVGAQLHVERIVSGKLQKQSHVKVYHLDSDSFSGIQVGGVFRMELPSPFIRQDVPVVVSQSDAPFGTYAAVDSNFLQVDYDRGYLYLDAQLYADRYIKVECTSGFEDGTTPFPVTGIADYDNTIAYSEGQKVVFNGVVYTCTAPTLAGTDPTVTANWTLAYVPMDSVPNAVYEAIMSLVPMVFNASQATNRSEEAKNQYSTMADNAALLLYPYVRSRGFSFRPLW